VLAPLSEIAPHLRIPGTNLTVAEALNRLNVAADEILETRRAWFDAVSFDS